MGEINITTRKFLETQLDEAFKAALNVYKVFTAKELFQFANLGPVSSKDGKFSGKLKVTKNFKTVVPSPELVKSYTDNLQSMPELEVLKAAMGYTRAFQKIVKFIVFIDFYSKGAKHDARGVFGLIPDIKTTADALVRRFSQDAILINEIRALGKIFFNMEQYAIFQRHIYLLLVAEPFATPHIDDIPGFLNTIFMIHRVMTKLLMLFQDNIAFLALYGLPYRVADTDRVLPPSTIRSFGVRFAEAYREYPNPQVWLDVTVHPGFYSTCFTNNMTRMAGETREIAEARRRKAREACPIFDDVFNDGSIANVNDDTKFGNTFKTVCAYMTSATSKGSRGPKATAFANALLNTLTLVFEDRSFEYRNAIAGITDIYLRLYRNNQPMLPMFDAGDVNYVFGPQTKPVRARQIYSPGIFTFQQKKGFRNASVKKAVFRTLLLRRMIIAGAMIKAILENKPGKKAYADLDGMNETKLLDEAKGIFEPGSYAIKFKLFN